MKCRMKTRRKISRLRSTNHVLQTNAISQKSDLALMENMFLETEAKYQFELEQNANFKKELISYQKENREQKQLLLELREKIAILNSMFLLKNGRWD